MSIEYVSQDDIEAHEAAMQRVDEDVKMELSWEIDKTKKLSAMQREFERLPLLRQVYHEAPNDVFELILSKCSDKIGLGGLNAFRLANKRLKKAAESCTTMLTNRLEEGPDSLPNLIIQRRRRIKAISCYSHNFRSLEGCPDGLTKILISDAVHLSDLSPLASCSKMESLEIYESSITDISVVSLMPLLEVFTCGKYYEGRPSIKDLSPLSSCPRLKELNLYGNRELTDLSPLSPCTALQTLNTSGCPLINNLSPLSAFTTLETLDIDYCHLITSLAPLSACTSLEVLYMSHRHLITSLAPLSACTSLEALYMSHCHLITSLAPLSACTSLETLNTSGCPLIPCLAPHQLAQILRL